MWSDNICFTTLSMKASFIHGSCRESRCLEPQDWLITASITFIQIGRRVGHCEISGFMVTCIRSQLPCVNCKRPRLEVLVNACCKVVNRRHIAQVCNPCATPTRRPEQAVLQDLCRAALATSATAEAPDDGEEQSHTEDAIHGAEAPSKAMVVFDKGAAVDAVPHNLRIPAKLRSASNYPNSSHLVSLLVVERASPRTSRPHPSS